jgi:hypothetical protein
LVGWQAQSQKSWETVPVFLDWTLK